MEVNRLRRPRSRIRMEGNRIIKGRTLVGTKIRIRGTTIRMGCTRIRVTRSRKKIEGH